jgi:hypothetical protein
MYSYRQIFMPYALINLGDRWFLPVNRRYKPLGHPDAWYDYEKHPSRVRIAKLTAKKAVQIGLLGADSAIPIDTTSHLYLYSDGTNPENSPAMLQRYEAIMAKLMKLDVQQASV